MVENRTKIIERQEAEIERLRTALKEARDAWADQLEADVEAAGDDEQSQPMLEATRQLIERCDMALEQKVDPK